MLVTLTDTSALSSLTARQTGRSRERAALNYSLLSLSAPHHSTLTPTLHTYLLQLTALNIYTTPHHTTPHHTNTNTNTTPHHSTLTPTPTPHTHAHTCTHTHTHTHYTLHNKDKPCSSYMIADFVSLIHKQFGLYTCLCRSGER